MKRFFSSLIAFAVASASLAVAAFSTNPAPLVTVAALSVILAVYALPADLQARIIVALFGAQHFADHGVSNRPRRMHGMAGEVEVASPELMAEIKKLGTQAAEIKGEVKQMAEKALADAKQGLTMSQELKNDVDKKLSEQGALVQEVVQKLDKLNDSGAQRSAPATIGRQVTDSQQFKDFVAAGGFKAVGHAMNLEVKELSSLTGAAGGVLVAPDRQNGLIVAPNRRMTVRDLLSPGRTSSNLVEFFRELLFTNNAAPVSETVLKPESNITFEEAQAAVKTIAHWIKASKQIVDDVPALESFIEQRLLYGLALVEEGQLLKGSGTGNNLLGIYTAATAYSLPSGATAVTTRIDTLRMMLLQAELAEYPATGIVLHPTDWANIEVQKDTTGQYLWANPTTTNGARLWGRDVVATQAMTQDTGLVGAFKLGAQIFDKETGNVVMSSENSDDFVKNRVTIRAEERLALAIYRPAAFVKNANLTP